ncbi:MAG: preprotein translocase subunit YajC [Clostridia bacterium]
MEYIQFIVTIIIILVIFYIANIQNKKQQTELKKMQSEIKKDDKVITYSGLSGIVSEVMEDRVILKVYPNMTEVSIEKWAIAGLDDREIDEPKKEEK